MRVEATDPVSYEIPVGDSLYAVNETLGKVMTLGFTGNIYCTSCGRKTKKSFSQGYCFPCFKSLAECDLCIMRPETCHYHLGTCRDTEWADNHCMQNHFVYLANSSGIKVGITRENQLPTRWIDQGASQAMAVFKVQSRFHSGLIEATLKKYVSDRTDWRKLLKGKPEKLDLVAMSEDLLNKSKQDLQRVQDNNPGLQWQLEDQSPREFNYPVVDYPEKITSLNLDKTAKISGVLQGIKGQYLIFDCGVLNIRKFTGYEVVIGP